MPNRCRYCKGPNPSQNPNIFACSKPECQQARYREWKRKKYGPLKTSLPRTCIHCKKEYILQDRRSNRRKFCYDPQCVEKNKKYAYQKAAKITQEWRKKPKAEATGRLCAICNKPLPANRHFRHDSCVENCSTRTDGDFKFYGLEDILDIL
jgi:hypothetical protein